MLSASDLEEAKRRMVINLKDPEVVGLLEKATQSEPSNPEAFHFLGRWAVANNRMQTAIVALQKAQSLAPKNLPASVQNYTLLAAAFDGQGLLPEAERSFKSALRVNRQLPNFNIAATYEYVRFLERERREPEAIPLVAEILRHNPKFGPGLLSQAREANRLSNFKQVIRFAEAALSASQISRSDLRAAHYLLAIAHTRLKQTDQAEKHQQWLTQDDSATK
jgi:tetratricopeptide (TPR) repeat protein